MGLLSKLKSVFGRSTDNATTTTTGGNSLPLSSLRNKPPEVPERVSEVREYMPAGRYIVNESITVWKAVDVGIAKLTIPGETMFVSPGNGDGKMRAERAVVEKIYKIPKHHTRDVEVPTRCSSSLHDKKFMYVVGETVEPEQKFDDNFTKACSSGIHFFADKRDAKNWYWMYGIDA